jgi:hypothetical protein
MNKFVKYTLVAFIAIVFLLGSFSSGLIVGHLIPANLFGNPGVSATPNDLQTLFAPFWEAGSSSTRNM